MAQEEGAALPPPAATGTAMGLRMPATAALVDELRSWGRAPSGRVGVASGGQVVMARPGARVREGERCA